MKISCMGGLWVSETFHYWPSDVDLGVLLENLLRHIVVFLKEKLMLPCLSYHDESMLTDPTEIVSTAARTELAVGTPLF